MYIKRSETFMLIHANIVLWKQDNSSKNSYEIKESKLEIINLFTCIELEMGN